jgi:short-subunit dehydrogenase
MIIVAGKNGLLGKECIRQLSGKYSIYAINRGEELPLNKDVLINCAGYVSFGSITNQSEEEVDKMLDANIKYAWKLSKDFINNGGKHIIHIGSTRSISVAPKKSMYSATKHALLALSRSINIDYEDVNSSIICPGSFSNKDTIQNVIDAIEFVISHPNVQEIILDGQI